MNGKRSTRRAPRVSSKPAAAGRRRGALIVAAVVVVAIGMWAWAQAPAADSHPDRADEVDRSPRASRHESEEATRPALGDGCREHAFFPVVVGTYRRYDMEVPGGRGELVLELASVTDTDDERVATWSVTLGLLGDTPATSRIERHCDRTGAQEPWVGYGLSTLLRFEHQTWRWPPSVSAGFAFSGTIEGVMGTIRGTVNRAHEVIGRESVTVPAGTFSTWYVETVDSPMGTSEGTHGSWWIAEHVGLVRSVQEVDAETTLVQELAERRDPTSASP